MRLSESRRACMILVALAGACRTPAADDPMAWTVGRWHGVRRAADDGQAVPMSVRVEPLPGGRGQVECLRVDGQPEAYTGFTLRVWDADRGGWLMLYVNSPERTFARLEGRLDGERSTWDSITPGRTRESRLVCERIGASGWRKTQLVSEDGGLTWSVLFTDELERDPVPP